MGYIVYIRRPEPCIILAVTVATDEFTLVPSTVRVIAEKIYDPVVDLIGHVKLSNFLHYSHVLYSVKCLREVKGKDTDLRTDRQHGAYSV